MQGWQTSYLGLRDLPRELSEFELQAFFSFGRDELEGFCRNKGAPLKAVEKRSRVSRPGSKTCRQRTGLDPWSR